MIQCGRLVVLVTDNLMFCKKIHSQKECFVHGGLAYLDIDKYHLYRQLHSNHELKHFVASVCITIAVSLKWYGQYSVIHNYILSGVTGIIWYVYPGEVSTTSLTLVIIMMANVRDFIIYSSRGSCQSANSNLISCLYVSLLMVVNNCGCNLYEWRHLVTTFNRNRNVMSTCYCVFCCSPGVTTTYCQTPIFDELLLQGSASCYVSHWRPF